MFTECRLLHHEINVFSGIAVKEIHVIIVMKIVLMGQTIVKCPAPFRIVDAHCVGHSVQTFEYSVG
jgi:hypothetical protein